MKKNFKIGGMTCAACATHVEKSVSHISGVSSCSVNLLTNTLTVESDNVSDRDIQSAVEISGYIFESSENSQVESISEPDKETKSMLRRFFVSLGFLIPLMYISMGHMLNFPLPAFFHGAENAIIFAFSQFLLLLPILYVNRQYFISGFKKLFRLSPNMDTLIAIGSAAAALYGIAAIFVIGFSLGHGNIDAVTRYSMDLYFESAAMILTLITLGKYFETKAKSKTGDSLKKLMNLAPKTATIIDGDNELTVDIDHIKKGDIVVAKAGDSVPVDGEVILGSGTVDQSAVTGESVPVLKEIGDKVISGTINTDGYLRIRADRVGRETTLSRIITLVEEAAGSKAPIAKLADKVSGIFVPCVLGIALVIFILWLAFGYGIELALNFAVAVLVISCPCALGLATPLAIMVGTGKGAESGILIKSGEQLETLGKITTIVFDKTGTLTNGKPSVVKVIGEDENMIVAVAAALERNSRHPLALAVCEHAEKRSIDFKEVLNFNNVSGKGISGEIDGKRYHVGSLRYMQELGIDFNRFDENEDYVSGEMSIFIADVNRIIGLIVLKDTLKNSAVSTIKKLKNMGLKCVVLTGDNRLIAEKLKNTLQIDEIYSELLPDQKAEKIYEMQSQGEHVAMVGDGINDAVALAAANVGIAVSSGTDIALDSAGIVLMRNDLNAVVSAIKLSRKVIANIKQNLFWAFMYNTIGIPIAAGALYSAFSIRLSPMLAAVAMSLSSIFVVLNSLRLKLFKAERDERGQFESLDSSVHLSIVKDEIKTMVTTLYIEGMSCGHCTASVEKALSGIDGVLDITVSLAGKKAVVKTNENVNIEILKSAVKNAGYEVVNVK